MNTSAVLRPELERKLSLLKNAIARRESMLVAYSGGVDSTLLAAIAVRVLPGMVYCVLVDRRLLPRYALREALRTAEELGLPLEVIPIHEIDESIRPNPPDRCYHCRKMEARLLRRRAEELGLSCVADGLNLSDLTEDRPGIRASEEEGIVHPFVEAGISKEELREIARLLGYSFWNRPPESCLATRLPYGEEITEERLHTIEEAEDFLRSRGITLARVRLHRMDAWIEVPAEELTRILEMRRDILGVFRRLGIERVALDLEGYRNKGVRDTTET